MAEAGHAREAGHAHGDADAAILAGQHAQARLERSRQVISRGPRGIAADRIGARGGPGRRARRPLRVADQRKLPQRHQQRGKAGQQGDDLDGGLTAFVPDHAAKARESRVPGLRSSVKKHARNRQKTGAKSRSLAVPK